MPRAETNFDVASPTPSRRSSAASGAGLRRPGELAEQLRRRRPDPHPRAGRGDGRALVELDPQVRAGLEESIARARRLRRGTGAGDSEVRYANGATVTHKLGSGAPRGPVCARRPGRLSQSVIMNVVPALAAGVGSHGPRLAAAEGIRRTAAPHHPGRRAAAWHGGGLRHRRGPGDRGLRLRRAGRG